MEIVVIVSILYFIVGLIRNQLKNNLLKNYSKVRPLGSEWECFKYIIKHPTIGDVIFMPVRVFLLVTVGILIGLIKLFFLLCK